MQDLELMQEIRQKQTNMYQDLHEMFQVADINKDGNLTLEEFAQTVSEHEEIAKKLHEIGVRGYELEWLDKGKKHKI